MKLGYGSKSVVRAAFGAWFVAFAVAACSKPEAAKSDDPPAEASSPKASNGFDAPFGTTGALPPGHPPIGDASFGHALGGPAEADGPDVAWDVPSAWKTAPNPNAMRRATYEVPASGDGGGAELTVSTAGGGVEANVTRWASQFGDAKPKTETRTVQGLKITTVEIKGTYAGGGPMMGGGAATPKEHAMLLGAIVEQGDREHFFKMTGSEKTLTAAKKDFDALVASIRPKS